MQSPSQYCIKFHSTLFVICLKFVLIEMLDEFITHIVRWYKTLYQVSPIVLTNCITTRRSRYS